MRNRFNYFFARLFKAEVTDFSIGYMVKDIDGFLQLIEIDSKPSKVNFFKSGFIFNL